MEHKLFPKDLRSAVRAMLLCQNRIVENETEKNMPCKSNGERNDQTKIHRREENRISSDCASSSSNFTEDDSYMTNSEGYHIESLSSEEDSSRSERMNCELTEFDLRGLTLHLLPKYLIYNILEFMVSYFYLSSQSKCI